MPIEEEEQLDPEILETTTDLMDEKLRSRKRAKDKREQIEEENFFSYMMISRIGRRALYKLIAATGHFHNVIFAVTPTGQPDQFSTFYHLGRKSIGAELFRQLELLDFDAVKMMLDENDPVFAKQKGRRT